MLEELSHFCSVARPFWSASDEWSDVNGREESVQGYGKGRSAGVALARLVGWIRGWWCTLLSRRLRRRKTVSAVVFRSCDSFRLSPIAMARVACRRNAVSLSNISPELVPRLQRAEVANLIDSAVGGYWTECAPTARPGKSSVLLHAVSSTSGLHLLHIERPRSRSGGLSSRDLATRRCCWTILVSLVRRRHLRRFIGLTAVGKLGADH